MAPARRSQIVRSCFYQIRKRSGTVSTFHRSVAELDSKTNTNTHPRTRETRERLRTPGKFIQPKVHGMFTVEKTIDTIAKNGSARNRHVTTGRKANATTH
eukprot:PhF_6_TR42922/c0_g1_i1/m.65077